MNPNVKTLILLGGLTGILVILGYFIYSWTGAIFFLAIAIAIDLVSYWFSDKIALRSAGARMISEREAPEVYSDLRDLSLRMKIPVPRLYFAQTDQANAFATGRDPKHSAICFTEGILIQLNRNQIRAVMAHELSHIKHHDTLISTIAAVISSSIAAIAQIGSLTQSETGDNRGSQTADFLLAILAPIAGILLQLAISRQREYAADYESALVTGRPNDLIEALENIEDSVNTFPSGQNPAFSSLYIESPITTKGILGLFSTHPSTEDRIRRLMQIPTRQ